MEKGQDKEPSKPRRRLVRQDTNYDLEDIPLEADDSDSTSDWDRLHVTLSSGPADSGNLDTQTELSSDVFKSATLESFSEASPAKDDTSATSLPHFNFDETAAGCDAASVPQTEGVDEDSYAATPARYVEELNESLTARMAEANIDEIESTVLGDEDMSHSSHLSPILKELDSERSKDKGNSEEGAFVGKKWRKRKATKTELNDLFVSLKIFIFDQIRNAINQTIDNISNEITEDDLLKEIKNIDSEKRQKKKAI